VTFLSVLEYTGSALGILGAILVISQHAKVRAAAFAVWTASNISLIALFVATDHYGLLNMQLCFLFTSIVGLVNNLRQPKTRRMEDLADAPTCWSTGTAPGETWVLVQTRVGECHIARLVGNPCVWWDDHGFVVPDVIGWRPLP